MLLVHIDLLDAVMFVYNKVAPLSLKFYKTATDDFIMSDHFFIYRNFNFKLI